MRHVQHMLKYDVDDERYIMKSEFCLSELEYVDQFPR